MATEQTDTEVLIVGYGPVGQVLAVLLAQRGRRVTVVERWPKAYTMPRAVAFDSESARILADAGIGGFIDEFAEPSGEYSWRNAAGETLLHIEASDHGLCGWPDSTSMYQPGLEAALEARGAELPTLTVLRGHEAVDLVDLGDQVCVTVDAPDGEELQLTAQYVVGCDGANSFVRRTIGGELHDLGFSYDWLICDVVPHDGREFKPNNLQVCDPARPRTSVSAGPGHRRWEFMRVPGETVGELNTAESAWRLLDLFDINQHNATLERYAVYTFNARWAERWRSGRLLLAGDAAHLMPPFAAQGMCSGFRDAANLAWKLELVLAGEAGEDLLDTYVEERRAHVQHAVTMSVNLGKVICQDDPVAAAERDAMMLAARERGVGAARPKAAVQPLAGGLLHLPEGRRIRPVGDLTPQGRVRLGGQVGPFDSVVGTGFVLLTAENPTDLLDADARSFLDGIGTRLVQVVPAGGAGEGAETHLTVEDLDDVYLPFLTSNRADSVLIRPDFYVFGGTRSGAAAKTAEVVEALRAQLGAAVQTG